MIVKNAYYPHQMPTKIVVELQAGAFYSADLSPFRHISEADLSPLASFSDAMGDEIPAYTLRFYGLALDSENPLKKERLNLGLSQKQLSDASGVNVRQIQKIESGEIRLENITLKSAVSLANALQIPVSSLLE